MEETDFKGISLRMGNTEFKSKRSLKVIFIFFKLSLRKLFMKFKESVLLQRGNYGNLRKFLWNP